MEIQSSLLRICTWKDFFLLWMTLYGPVYGGVRGGLAASVLMNTCEAESSFGGTYVVLEVLYVCWQGMKRVTASRNSAKGRSKFCRKKSAGTVRLSPYTFSAGA